MVELIYCRRCDLAFCQKHVEAHPKNDHEVSIPPPGTVGCCVCLGIYRPSQSQEEA